MATTNTVADIVVQALKKFKVKCDSIYMKFTDTKNDLNSTSTNTPLSANQGKVLADKITTTNTNIGTLSSLTTSVKTSIVNAINSLVTAVDGKAPTSHASTGTTYGVGTTTSYGHVKTINSLTQSSHTNGTSLSAYQGKVLNDKIDVLNNNLGFEFGVKDGIYYKKYNNGSLEMWGKTIHGAYSTVVSEINLPIAYCDTEYNILITPVHNGNNPKQYWVGDSNGNSEIYTNLFKVASVTSASPYSRTFAWRTIGKWK